MLTSADDGQGKSAADCNFSGTLMCDAVHTCAPLTYIDNGIWGQQWVLCANRETCLYNGFMYMHMSLSDMLLVASGREQAERDLSAVSA